MVDFISYWYIHPSHQGSENYAGKSKLSSPQPLHPALPGESQARDLVSPVCPGSSKGSPPSGTCPDHLTREASRSHLAKSLYTSSCSSQCTGWRFSLNQLRLLTELVTMGSLCGVQGPLKTDPTCCRKCKPNSVIGHTGTKQPVSGGLVPGTTGVPPHRTLCSTARTKSSVLHLHLRIWTDP